MPTVAQLVARPDPTIGYVLFVEGSYLAYTTHPDLVGEGASSWVGTANGARKVIEGLLIDEAMTVSDSISTETGMMSTDGGTVTFVIEDLEGEVVAFMREQSDADTVGEMLLPLTDPAPANLLTPDGVDLVPLHGRFLNKEAIGTAGERNIFQVFPGDPMPGLAHCAYTGDQQSIAVSQVYTSAPFLEGRRVALYRVFKDVTSIAAGYLAWPSWDLQSAEPESLAFLGTLGRPEVDGRTWSFPCAGIASWLVRQLNTSRPTKWEGVSSTVYLSDTPGAREDLMGVSLYYQEGGTGTVLRGDTSYFDPALDTLPLTGLPSDYRTAINARIAVLAGNAGPDIQWDAFYTASARLEAGYTVIKIDDAGWAACMTLLLPEKIIRYLGYSPDLQSMGGEKLENEGKLQVYNPEEVEALGFGPPGGSYWALRLSTTPLGYSNPTEALNKADNDGKPRIFQAMTDEGIEMLYPSGDQELLVGLDADAPFIQGQTNRAPGDHEMTDSGGTVDTQGYFAFKASYQESADADAVTMVQVAKCGWVNDTSFSGANFGKNATGYRQLWIERWLHPYWFGMKDKPLGKVWASLDLTFAPFAMIGYQLNFGDRADLVMLRTLLSTGTSYWTGLEGQNPVRTLGVNAHPDATWHEGNDVEIADLGLQVPAQLIDYGSFTKTCALLPGGGHGSPLARVKFGFIGSFDSQELLARIMAPRGWALGWVRGKIRLLSLAQEVSLSDVEVTIEPDDFAAPQGSAELFVEAVEFGPLTAKDKFTITVSNSLVEEAAPDEPLTYSTNAHDPASRTRQGNVEHSIDGAGCLRTDLWVNYKNPPESWGGAWSTLWGTTMAGFYGSSALQVTVNLRWSKARMLGAGSRVRFSSYFAAGLDGQYGITNRVGTCMSVVRNLLSGEAEVKLLLQPGDATLVRQWGPIAWVLDDVATVEERHDAANRTFYLYSNWFGVEEATHHDVTAFEEPAALNVGGDALVEIWQHDGRTFSKTAGFTVESISESGDSITYAPGSLTGTFHEGQYACLVMAAYDDQPADSWARQLFSVHTRSNAKFGGVPTKGFKLK